MTRSDTSFQVPPPSLLLSSSLAPPPTSLKHLQQQPESIDLPTILNPILLSTTTILRIFRLRIFPIHKAIDRKSHSLSRGSLILCSIVLSRAPHVSYLPSPARAPLCSQFLFPQLRWHEDSQLLLRGKALILVLLFTEFCPSAVSVPQQSRPFRSSGSKLLRTSSQK